jgi:hypothetical protein
VLTSQPLSLHAASSVRTVTAGTSTNQLVSLSSMICLSPVSDMHKMGIQVDPNIPYILKSNPHPNLICTQFLSPS